MAKRARLAKDMRCPVLRVRTRMQGVMVGLVLVVFLTGDLLLRAGNIETNPGPDSKDIGRTVQTRLTAAGGRSGSGDRRNSANAAGSEPTLNDVMSKLIAMDASMNAMNSTMNTKLDQVRDDVQEIRSEFSHLQQEVQTWKEKVESLEKENENLRESNQVLLDRVSRVEKHADDLEGRSRRSNVLFYGLDRLENETQEELEGSVRDLITDQLELAENIEFDRVHRVSGKRNAPVIAKCTFYKDKVKLMKAKQKLKGTDIFIGEDFSRGVRECRKKLAKFSKEMKDNGQSVKMVFDHLVVDGKKFFLSEDGESVVEGR
jgi:DNA repair exonuclease SbcCD ATPase subunit